MINEEYFLDRMMKIFPLPKWIKNSDLHKKDKTKMLLLFTKKLKIREIEDLCSTFEYYGTFKKKKDEGEVEEGDYHNERSEKALEKSKEDFPQLKNIKKC